MIIDSQVREDQEAQDPVVQTAPQATPPQPVAQPLTGRGVPADDITPAITGTPADQAVHQQPISDQAQQFKDGEQGEQVRASRWDKWAAGWDLLSHSMPVGLPGADEVGALSRGYIRSQMQDYSDRSGLAPLSADEANRMYPDRPEPYSSPVSPIIADMEYRDRQRIKAIQAWKNSGDATPWTDRVQGLAGGFADPMILALSTAMGPLARAAGIPLETGLGGLAQTFEHNMALNLATGELTRKEEQAEGEKAPMGEMIAQSAESALGGTLFHYGISKPFGKWVVSPTAQFMRDAFHGFFDATPEVQEKMTKEVVTAMEQNRTPVLDAQNRVLEERKAGAVQDGENVQRTTPPQEMPAQVYAAADTRGAKKFTPAMGEGTQLTSSPDVANNAASRPEGSEPGKIGTTSIEGKKLLNLDEPAHSGEETHDFVQALEKETGIKLQDELPLDDMSLKDVVQALHDSAGLEGIPADIDQKIQEVAKRAGYEGFKFTGRDASGEVTDHQAHLFDKEHPVQTAFEANPESTPKITPDQQEALDKAQETTARSEYSTPEVDEAVHEMRHGPVLGSDANLTAEDQMIAEIEQQSKEELKRLAEELPAAKEALEELQRQSADQKQVGEMAKQLADCVTGELV